jgi:glycosyltransferase involved in cell wall biosynthesis
VADQAVSKLDIFVSVLSVVQDHAAVLGDFVEETYQLLEENYTNFEIVLVDNASTDDTAHVIDRLLGSYKCIRALRLSRDVDDETAIMAGLDAAIGDFVVMLHADHDPPALIPAMVEQCRAGHDVVLGVEQNPAPPGPLYRLLRRAFLSLTRWLLHTDLLTDATGCRALSRHAVNALIRFRRRKRYFALLVSDIGLGTTVHLYQLMSRSGTQRRPSLFRAARTGLSILVHNSIVPLRLVSLLGLIGSLLSFLYSLYVIVIFLFKEDVRPGWTTMSLQVSGLFVLVFLMLTLMSEYLTRLLEEFSDRPLYHVRQERSSSVMLSDLTRRNVLNRSVDEPEG